MEGWNAQDRERLILQRSITRRGELWHLLHQVPCGFIALGRCFKKEQHYYRKHTEERGKRETKPTVSQKSFDKKKKKKDY